MQWLSNRMAFYSNGRHIVYTQKFGYLDFRPPKLRLAHFTTFSP